jgi:hypothetical protein
MSRRPGEVFGPRMEAENGKAADMTDTELAGLLDQLAHSDSIGPVTIAILTESARRLRGDRYQEPPQ